MTVKSFQFKNLKKVSEEETLIIDKLYNLLPATSARDTLNLEIKKMLLRNLGEKSFYYLDAVTKESFPNFLGNLPEFPVLAAISLESTGGKMILQLDQNLAHLLIDKLLGGNGETGVENRALSETEQGVIQYLIMQVLAQIWKTLGTSAKVHFRFEKFYFDRADIEKFGNKNESAVSMVFKAGIGEFSGFVKAIFLESFLNKLEFAGEGKMTGPELKYFFKNLNKFDYVHTTLWADAGKATVSPDELISLEEGDVILFDETGLSLVENEPKGEVSLRVGSGTNGGFRADIKAAGKKIECIVKGT